MTPPSSDLKLLQEKHAQLDSLVPSLEVDAWLVYAREGSDPSAALFAGFEMLGESALLFTRAGRKLAVVADYDAGGAEEAGVYQQVIGYSGGFAPVLNEALDGEGIHTLALSFSPDDPLLDGLPYGLLLRLKEHLEDPDLEQRVVSAAPLLRDLRSLKTPEELRRIREAVRITETIFAELDAFLRPGMSEREAAEFIKARQRHHGVTASFGDGANVQAGRYGVGHRGPSDRPMLAGDTVLVDMGVFVEGYTSDLQRSYYVAAPGEATPPAEVQHRFRVAQGAMHAAIREMRPGIMARELDELARAYLAEHGVEPYHHALGHQIGRSVHDAGTLLARICERYGERGDAPLRAGEVYTVEPVLAGTTGVDGHPIGVEQDVLVTADGHELLSTPQDELVVIR